MADTAGALGEIETKVFISYSRKDMGFADRLEAALKARGFEVLIDREEIYAFEDWWRRIQALIGQADTVVFVLSPDAGASREALREVEYAASLNKRFAPIVCRRVEDRAVPEALRRLNFIFFDEAGLFDASADKLAVALHTDIGWIRKHTEFGEAARRWSAAGRPGPRGLLLRSPVLEEAERWIASRPKNAPPPTEETRAFVAESRRDSMRRRRRALALVGAFVGVMIAASAAWLNQDWLKERIYAAVNVTALKTAQERALKPGDPPFKECRDCPEMVVVPARSFMMGPRGAELPYKVAIAKPFAVAKYELTFAEWDACEAHGGCARISDSFGRRQQPVINVTWAEAKKYVSWISRLTGRPYRLLSEAEYEYATRAGTRTAYPWGEETLLNGTAMANCMGCDGHWPADRNQIHSAPVGSFSPNKFGLYDMVGNVWEWTEDCPHNVSYVGAPHDGSVWLGGDCTFRVARGGAYDLPPGYITSDSSSRFAPDSRLKDLGFRVARTLDRR